jgi:hypothetical protein
VRQIGSARRAAALDDAVGNLFDYGVERHVRSFLNLVSEILLQFGSLRSSATPDAI